MSDDDANQPPPDRQQQQGDRPEEDGEPEMAEDDAPSSSSSSSSSEYDSDYSSDDYGRGDGGDGGGGVGGYDQVEEEPVDDNSPEYNLRRFAEVLDSRRNRKKEEEEDREYEYPEDIFDFPRDPEKWREEDIRELWADGPIGIDAPGWDPVFADEDDWEAINEAVEDGHDPPIAPFYLPYRKYYPVIPDNHHDIATPKAVVEELDRIEEFLQWVSYIFEDGSSYEGTVWDDLAQGKGVYVAEEGLVRYEGEWLQNQMEGHGVVEVEIPGVEPVPGSKLEAKMRAEGRIISRDFMSPEDRKWLEMDIEDSIKLSGRLREIPFYERKEWVEYFGSKPEKGRYKYAGQWKHGRMHGCGVYEFNERIIYGRFYFGEHLEDSSECTSDISMLHAGIAEVAAAKARMFANKPDGMVREERGPYSDPQHPYFYEEDDVWMAPGFINQFYDVPDYWKTYAQEVDQERERWLNSFYKAPLRIPMPAELEYWWSKDNVDTEFVLINKEPEPDPEDPSKLIYTEDPLILHTPSGRIINYVEDDEYGVRLFWQPVLKEGEEVDPEKAVFLPLGYDEFFGRSPPVEKKGALRGMLMSVHAFLKPFLDKLGSWAEEKMKGRELNLKLIEKELDFIEAEISLGEAMEDLDMELKRKQEEEENQAAAGKDQDDSFASGFQDEALPDEKEVAEKEEEEEDDDDEGEPTSFGIANLGKANDDTTPKDSKPGKSPFSSLSLSITSPGLLSMVPPKLHESFLSWKTRCSSGPELSSHTTGKEDVSLQNRHYSVKFHYRISENLNLRAVQQRQTWTRRRGCSSLDSLASMLSSQSVRRQREMDDRTNHRSAGIDNLSILSLQIPVSYAPPPLFQQSSR